MKETHPENDENETTSNKSDQRYVAYNGPKNLKWDDIALTSKVHPELETYTRLLIENLIGFLPSDPVLLPREAYIRSLIHQNQVGSLANADFHAALDKELMELRNNDLKKGGWLRNLAYGKSEFDKYENYMPHLKAKARDRLCWALGYEPKLAYSLEVELFLRDCMADDGTVWPNELTFLDKKLMVVTEFRRDVIESGLQVAESSPLICYWKNWGKEE